ncbi:sugar-binding transcriptional regulator [Halanaerobium hydrogeniformans]|uniref:Transcriptional regulator, MarR family n=1 Tax=Halanaerobium hydrogeniformans TaxID=656519 RepID=E4RKW1_HALHG|nr:sugar-binding transcriptional regulator [Halanaerobium hydrogeniformans]ADQ15702.1 transcriptional regulator, MarR family [Halanaerobium hydrogeniformans]
MTNQRYCKKLKAAKYYYNENLTQQEIADRLYMSRPTVSKMLKEAKEEGIVQFKIVDVQNKCNMFALEDKLIKTFSLKNAIVTDYDNSFDNLKDKIGEAAAEYFDDLVQSNMEIGFSWGSTLKAMVKNLSFNHNINNLKLITLVGGSGTFDADVHSNIIIENVLDKYDGKGHFLYAPAVVDNKELKNNLINNKETKELLDRAKNVDVAFVGIGSIEELAQRLNFNKQEMQELKSYNAVGDVCSRFYDSDGKLCPTEINERIIGIDLESLRDIKTVVGVAGGEGKIEAITAALKGGFLDVLVTDKITAEKVLAKGCDD